MASMQFVGCSFELHGQAIREIINEVILNSTAVFDYRPRSAESMAAWFNAKAAANFPVIGAVENELLIGFATYGTFRAWPAYKYTVEHSVYVDREQRGKGIGVALMRELIRRAEEQDYHTMVGGIDAANRASIALHEKLGFRHAGTIHHAGFKFGQWLDLTFYQLALRTPEHPVDG